jgi:hypothetical protein
LIPVVAMAVSGLAFALLVVISAELLGFGLWINPGPLVLGIYLDSLLSSRREASAGERTAHSFGWLDLSWKVPLWIVAAVFWMQH